MSITEPVVLASQSSGMLFETLDESEGEVVLDLTLERNSENPYLRVYNGNAQMVIAHKLDESDENDYRLESQEISRSKFNDLVTHSEMILLSPRSKTPFSREAQRQLSENTAEYSL